ncbi:MAG: alpha-glucosidase 2 [Anaerocolumna sp.]|jgi:alpha-glucosidase|nr:alpha-glucosidase 2 [Anaerocolumna sp.]
MFGKIKALKQDKNVVIIDFEQQQGQIEIITENIINVFSGFETKEHQSRAIEEVKSVNTEYVVIKKEDRIEIKTTALYIEIFDEFKVDFYDINHNLICADYRNERKVSTQIDQAAIELAAKEGHFIDARTLSKKIQVVKVMDGDECFYGLGDKTGFLNKRGYEYEMWNSDLPEPQVDSFKALYKSIPFFITLKKNHVFGIFYDNTYRTYFDMGKESDEYYYFGADDGNLDYYFIAGDKMPEIIEGYTYLTGRTPLPQLWTLGYHQSRWSYETKEEVKDIAKHFRELDIPCDVIHLDIDYMEDYKVFTWSNERFKDADKVIEELNQDGFKIVTIIDPGVKIEKGYTIYDEGIKNGYYAKDVEGNVYENAVWPGLSVYPDFSDEKVRNWWGDNQKLLLQKGVRGVWNDMNEPASFNGPLPDDVQFLDEGKGANHKKIHNVYGHLMAKATYEGLKRHDKRRPFVITRACYSGTQKYSTGWTGDNHSIWAHLQMAIPQLCNLGMSGLTFIGTDVGGFGSDCTAELLNRWVQVGCFSPLFRNHCCKPNRRQEPWAFNQETLDINRKYIKLHYTLLPYLYDLFWESQSNGLPIMRPLVLHYQNDRNVKEINDQFLFGETILVAPVVVQGQRARSIYLPEGNWIDYWTKEVVTGGKYILREAPLDVCPIYLKAGSIIPNYPELHYVGEKEVVELTLDVYEGVSEYHHYQDNGEDFEYEYGEYNEYLFSIDDKGIFTVQLASNGYSKIYQSFKVLYKGKIIVVPFNGEKVEVQL